MDDWPWYVHIVVGIVTPVVILLVAVGIWLLLHVAVRILLMKTERDLLRIKLAAFGLDVDADRLKREGM